MRLLLIATLLAGCTNSSEKGPEAWTEWVKEKRESFKEKFSVPTFTHHIYLKEGEKAYIAEEVRGVRFIAPSCKEKCLFLASFEKGRVLLKNLKKEKSDQIIDEKKQTKLMGSHYISYVFYKEEAKARLFLYDTAQKDLEKKRKRYFFDYDKSYKVQSQFHWLDKPETVTFSRSDGSQKNFRRLGLLKYQLKGKSEVLSVYQSDASKAFDKTLSVFSLMYRDSSNNKKTYGAGRFLVVDFGKPIGEMKSGDAVSIDLNYSYNPPCASSTGFHCPLPQDSLSQAVWAGESYYKFQ